MPLKGYAYTENGIATLVLKDAVAKEIFERADQGTILSACFFGGESKATKSAVCHKNKSGTQFECRLRLDLQTGLLISTPEQFSRCDADYMHVDKAIAEAKKIDYWRITSGGKKELWYAPLSGYTNGSDGENSQPEIYFVLKGQVAQGIGEKLTPTVLHEEGHNSYSLGSETKISPDVFCDISYQYKRFECRISLQYRTGAVIKWTEMPSFQDDDDEFVSQLKKEAKKNGYWRQQN